MLNLGHKPLIMGVLNITPDSFYQGSRCPSVDEALGKASQMIEDGVDIIDIGGEATNPMLDVTEIRVSEQEELDRVMPVVERIKQVLDVRISIDTSKAGVIREVSKLGVDLINDQRALTMPDALEAVAQSNLPVCLMHMFGLNTRIFDAEPPETVLKQIIDYLQTRAAVCLDAGIDSKNILLDPGFGHGNFGKSTKESLYILKHLEQLNQLGYPVLVGLSRKTLLGEILDEPPQGRLYGSLALAMLAIQNSARIIRVHDVKATKHIVDVWCAYNGSSNESTA